MLCECKTAGWGYTHNSKQGTLGGGHLPSRDAFGLDILDEETEKVRMLFCGQKNSSQTAFANDNKDIFANLQNVVNVNALQHILDK